MESSEEVAVGLFAIGPSTALERAIAFRVLFCMSSRKLLAFLNTVISHNLRRLKRSDRGICRKFGATAMTFLLSLLNPYVGITVAVAAALFIRRQQMVKNRADVAYRRNFWRNVMKGAYTYEEWAHAAKMLEKDSSSRKKDSDLYDEDLVREKLTKLQMRRTQGTVQDIVFCLRTDLVRNLGNMCNPELHKGRLQVPSLIQEYIDEVRYHLRAVCDTESEDLPLEEKLAFIHETRHAFGRTALLLSGGAALGAFHMGVVRTLIEHHLLPRVVAGASVGSIICSFIATRTWAGLQSFFGEGMPALQLFEQLGGILAVMRRLLTKGAFHEIRQLQVLLRELTYNLTFQEAYDMTGRVLGISVSSPRRHEPPRCLTYLTSPHVVIWSAVAASCAFPGLFEAQQLMAKDRDGQLIPYHSPVQVGTEEQAIGMRHWRDGSLESDLPMIQLKELFNVNHFIVSQANPHIAPLLRVKDMIRAYGGDFAAKLAHLVEMEVKHRCTQIWELGFPMCGLAKLFAQDWEGDVTIVMPATLAQFVRMIQNPTPLELQKAVIQGRQSTWEKVSAIKANCGIELMLDECVSELSRLRRLKRSFERDHIQTTGFPVQSLGERRNSPRNCLARERSWGSLDEDGTIETMQAEVPLGGPSVGMVRSSRGSSDGSDSDADNIELGHYSWKRLGPLMRTSSATNFLQEYCQEKHQPQDSSDSARAVELASHAQLRGNNSNVSRQGSKIFDKIKISVAAGSSLSSQKYDDVKDPDFLFPDTENVSNNTTFLLETATIHRSLPKLGSNDDVAACECSEEKQKLNCSTPVIKTGISLKGSNGSLRAGSTFIDNEHCEGRKISGREALSSSEGICAEGKGDITLNPWQLTAVASETAICERCSVGAAEASLREAIGLNTHSCIQDSERNTLVCGRPERGGFGSFFYKADDPSDFNDFCTSED